jgi:hypothetical protein
VGSGPGKINREEIAAIVDRFLANRSPEETADPAPRQTPQRSEERAQQTGVEPEAGSMYTGASQTTRPTESSGGNGRRSSSSAPNAKAASSGTGNTPVDFVSEDDVKRAIQRGEKIYINSKTIITPAARDIGEPGEVFAKG